MIGTLIGLAVIVGLWGRLFFVFMAAGCERRGYPFWLLDLPEKLFLVTVSGVLGTVAALLTIHAIATIFR